MDALTDEDIEKAALSDPDDPPTDADFWKDATVVMPENIEDSMHRHDDSTDVPGIPAYDTLNAKKVRKAIQGLEPDQISTVWQYERHHKKRKSVVGAIYNRMVHSYPKALKAEFQREVEKGFTILIAGQTGVGKSETVNSLFGKQVAKTNDFTSETKVVTPFEGRYHNVNYTIYDTPGLGELDRDRVGLNEKYLSLMREQCPSPDVLWYALRLDVHVTEPDVQYLQLIHKNFRDAIWDRAMIVLTHADHISAQDFQRILEAKTKIVNDEIDKVTARKSRGLPSVAVANKHKHTPDGADWLGELFTTSIEQLNPERLTPFLFAFAADLKVPNTQKTAKLDASEGNEQAPEKRIELNEEQLCRVEEKVSSSNGLFAAIAAGASIGMGVDAALAGGTLGLGTVIGGIVGFVSWFWGQ